MALTKNKKYYVDRLGELETEYTADGWEAVAKDKTQYLYPHGRNLSNADEDNDGERKDLELLDSTSLTAVTVATSGMYAGTTNPIEKYFKLADEDKELNDSSTVSDYYQKSTDIILIDYAKSNFYTTMELMFRDLLTYSISCIIMDEDDERIFNFTHVPNGQYYIDVDFRGEVVAMYRKFKKRSRDIVEEYGEENVSQNISKDIEGDKTGGCLHTLLHVIERNRGRDIDKQDNLNMPWRSVTYELDNDHNNDKTLRESGYRTRPFIAPRWSVSSGNKYGNGPGDDALGFVKQLQEVTRMMLLAVDKSINKPMVAPENGPPVNDGPGEVTREALLGAGKSQLRPLYEVDTPIDKLIAIILDLRETIKKIFLADLFFAQGEADPRETATLTRAKQQELLRLLGPIMQRISIEALHHLIRRAHDIEARLGRLPDPPEEIIGREPKVDIISSLMKAQELGVIGPIEAIMVTIGQMAEVWPESVDMLNPDAAINEIEQAYNIPTGVIRADRVVKELRALRDQAIVREQQAIDTQQTIDGAQQLSQTDLSGDNALNAVLEG